VLEGVSHLVIDEVHERDLDTDFLLAVLRELMVRPPAPRSRIASCRSFQCLHVPLSWQEPAFRPFHAVCKTHSLWMEGQLDVSRLRRICERPIQQLSRNSVEALRTNCSFARGGCIGLDSAATSKPLTCPLSSIAASVGLSPPHERHGSLHTTCLYLSSGSLFLSRHFGRTLHWHGLPHSWSKRVFTEPRGAAKPAHRAHVRHPGCQPF
jgi:hypothetical protein